MVDDPDRKKSLRGDDPGGREIDPIAAAAEARASGPSVVKIVSTVFMGTVFMGAVFTSVAIGIRRPFA